MNRQQKQGYGIIWLACLLFLAGCGLPSDLKKEAEQKPQQIASARAVVSKQEAKFNDFKKTDRFDFFEVYATRENWEKHFAEAAKMLDQAEKEVSSGRVAFLLRENNKDKAGTLRVELLKVDRLIRQSLMMAKKPTDRMADLERIQQQAPELVAAAGKSMAGIDLLVEKLEKEVVPMAKKDYPDRSGDIDKRFAPLRQLQSGMKAALAAAGVQLALHEKKETADYAIIGSNTDAVNAGFAKMKENDKAYRKAIGHLYQSYTKILDDMKIDHFVTVGRVSWDEDSDFWTEHTSIYPPARVTPKVYDYFARLNPKTVPATFSTSWGGSYKIFIPQQYWGTLNVDPTRNWPSRADNRAEFWIEDFFPKAYHRYTVIHNDKKQQTDWVLVDEEDYYEYYDFLGMEILSKPYGFFEVRVCNQGFNSLPELRPLVVVTHAPGLVYKEHDQIPAHQFASTCLFTAEKPFRRTVQVLVPALAVIFALPVLGFVCSIALHFIRSAYPVQALSILAPFSISAWNAFRLASIHGDAGNARPTGRAVVRKGA